MALGDSTSNMILGSKGQRSKVTGHKVQKDGVAGLSYALYRVPSLSMYVETERLNHKQTPVPLSVCIVLD